VAPIRSCIHDAFYDARDWAENWEYSGRSGRLYTVTVSESQAHYIQYLQSDACGCNTVDWSKILINISIENSRTLVTLSLAGLELFNYLFKKIANWKAEGRAADGNKGSRSSGFKQRRGAQSKKRS
jgi:hypothetical protein